MQTVLFQFSGSTGSMKILSIKNLGSIKNCVEINLCKKKEHLVEYFVISEVSNTVRDDLNYLLVISVAENKCFTEKITMCKKDDKLSCQRIRFIFRHLML